MAKFILFKYAGILLFLLVLVIPSYAESSKIQCKESHVLSERPNGKFACVNQSTADKLNWITVENYNIGIDNLTYNDIREITYSYDIIPDVQNQTIILDGMYGGIDVWEKYNIDLKFIEVENYADIKIHWDKLTNEHYLGLAESSTPYMGDIYIGLGSLNCNDKYIQLDKDSITSTTAHELGHILGFGHTLDESHLMYGLDYLTSDNFESIPHMIPTVPDGDYVGFNILEIKYDELEILQNQLEPESQTLQLQYDTLLQAYEKYPEFIDDQMLYDQSMLDYEKLEASRLVLNEIIDKQNTLTDNQNLIVDQMTCYPDVAADES